MARIEDEIGKIADPVLRATLLGEVKKLKTDKRFGLVFEEHLPELVPVYNARVKARSLVVCRSRTFSETLQVLRVHDGMAEVEKSDSSRENIPVDELTVVRRFGEPIFPSLRPFDRVRNGDTSQPHHILIEADNYHALQLLEYCYSGKVDCIYIDPPYNTGAKDWKYNNDFVDGNDTWRHSKWLSMMKKRLQLGIRLLKEDGIICITIDDYELHHLRMLIEDALPGLELLGIAVIRNNPGGRATAKGFAVNHESAIFLGKSANAQVGRLDRSAEQLSRYDQVDAIGSFEWANFRKHGAASDRKNRPKQFYPFYVKIDWSFRIPLMEWQPYKKVWKILENPTDDEYTLWPTLDGREKVWGWGAKRVFENPNEFLVKQKNDGSLQIYKKERPKSEGRLPGTWWEKTSYSSNESGTKLLQKILGDGQDFPFPKSLYAVVDSLKACNLQNKPNALIVDFFAGSGTTLNAINLINSTDNGNRQCILVTNNEVSEYEGKTLTEQGHRPSSEEWNKHGICQLVTFPRNKYTMLGHRDDGTVLEGEYLTGQMVTKEKPRTFKQLSFAESSLLSLVQRKQLVSLINKVPQSKITADMPFFVDDVIPATILFDIEQVEEWLESLEYREHITEFYLVTQDNKAFISIKQLVQELLGPTLVEEEERRPLKEGFPTNLEYFKLDFLDPTEVQMGRQFAAILPLLWMMAGSIGPLPDAPKAQAPWLIPADCPFAVLLQEKRFKEFHRHIKNRPDLTHVFIVTNSYDTYHNLREEIEVPNVVQLYKDYLQNFKINYSKDRL